MMSLNARQIRTPAEDLQSSQGVTSCMTAHSTSRMQSSPVWVLASWNVLTLLDVDGRIETAMKGVDEEATQPAERCGEVHLLQQMVWQSWRISSPQMLQ